MSTLAFAREFQMREMRCGQCGIVFWAPEFFMADKEKTKEGWYCPNGHCRAFRESDADRVRRELAEEKRLREAAEQRTAMERSMRIDAEKRLKRQTRRVHAGVCPCCNLTFQNLQRHMQTQHSDAARPPRGWEEWPLGQKLNFAPFLLGETLCSMRFSRLSPP